MEGPMVDESTAGELAGKDIKQIFRSAEGVVELHASLTSLRGDNFRLRLLQAMETPLDEESVERLRIESGVVEYHRHLNRLMGFGLVELREMDGKRLYVRTPLAEQAINALRALERRVGEEAIHAIYSASLGPNSIRLFLRVYGDTAKASWEHMQVRYTPAEIGRLSLFLPRVIEGISSIDKLNEAGLLSYQDDNYIYMHPTKARGFYQYLQELHRITQAAIPALASRS